MHSDNVVDLQRYRSTSRQELIDEISARTFLFLRDSARSHELPIESVIAEHMLGMALVVEAVEGSDYARELLAAVAKKLSA